MDTQAPLRCDGLLSAPVATPTGAVTLSPISEGSTRPWDTDAPVTQVLVAAHDTLVHTVVGDGDFDTGSRPAVRVSPTLPGYLRDNSVGKEVAISMVSCCLGLAG